MGMGMGRGLHSAPVGDGWGSGDEDQEDGVAGHRRHVLHVGRGECVRVGWFVMLGGKDV